MYFSASSATGRENQPLFAPRCNRMERLFHGKNTPHPAPGRRDCAAPHRPRRQGHPTQGVRRPGDAIRRQALFHPQPASGPTGLEDGGRRRDRDRNGGTCPRPLDADRPSGRRRARRGRSRRSPVRAARPRKSSPDTAAAGNQELSGRIASTFAGRFSPFSGDVPSGR